MASMNGVNKHMGGYSGKTPAASQPFNATKRGNMSKGGVNTDLGGGAKASHGPKLAAGTNGTGKMKHDAC